ncbi:uncharacterized protein LOC135503351 [Lineus longissimus]|uniref:uncharacterized protein LOC135503351 n=1 Tax=Lineus longissimus TaxID=88925 RepID=UPI002B4E0585
MEALRKSGIEEEYNEREQLLQEIRELKEEADTVKKDKKVEDKRKREKEENEGEAIRLKAMEGMNKPEVTPTKKAKFDVGEYLTKKLELETRRFEAEKEKMAAEAQEKRALIELLGKLASDMNKKEQ